MGIASSVPWSRYDMTIIGEVADGESAWDMFRMYHPDIVITDIRMPKMDGLELIARIRGEDPECRIVVVTNVEYGEACERAKALGVNTFLLKATMNRDDLEKVILRLRYSLNEPDDPSVHGRNGPALLADLFGGGMDYGYP